MGNVAMLQILGLEVPIFKPFLQLSCFSDLVRGQPGPRYLKLPTELGVTAKYFGCADAIGKEIAQDLFVHRGPGANGGAKSMLMLRRQRRIRDEPFVFWVFNESISMDLAPEHQ